MTRLAFGSVLVGSLAVGSVALPQSTQERSDAKADLWQQWDEVLEGAVSEEGWVDYDALDHRYRSALASCSREIGTARLDKMDRRAQMAFWINAYNVLCTQTLLDHELPATVPHASFLGTNIFTEETYKIAGHVRSLDEIEHEILRKRFKDNRVHAALVCGASSCPRLRREAYRGTKLDQQLDEESRRWIQTGRDKKGRRKNYLAPRDNVLHVSKIFEWLEQDFGNGDEGIRDFVARFSNPEDAALIRRHEPEIQFLPYDWHLNRK